MREAFDRVLTLDQVERTYGGVADPADAALAAMPGSGAAPARSTPGGTALDPRAAAGDHRRLARLDRQPRRHPALGPRRRQHGRPRPRPRRLGPPRGPRPAHRPTRSSWLDNARAAQDAVDTIAGGIDPITGERRRRASSTSTTRPPSTATARSRSRPATSTPPTTSRSRSPGFGTDAESAPYQAERALTLYESTRYLDGSQTNASMFWIGYDAPDNVPWDEGWDAGRRGDARTWRRHGGERLADTLDGLRASRDGDPAHLTAIGHSYGSTTTGHAAHDHGIPVDDLVFVGSPGVGGDTDNAGDTGVDPDHVWAGANSRDPIADLGNHGWIHLETLGRRRASATTPPRTTSGRNRFQAESTTRARRDRARRFERPLEVLRARHRVALQHQPVVNGNYDAVHATPTTSTDPWYAGPQDPEFDRDPTAPDTGRTRERRRTARARLAVLVVALALTAAGSAARRRRRGRRPRRRPQLEQQRDDVRAATGRAAAGRRPTALGGTGHASHRRLARAASPAVSRSSRTSATSPTPGSTSPTAHRPRPRPARRGLRARPASTRPSAGERPGGGAACTAERDDVRASFSELPGQGDYVLLTVARPVHRRPRGRARATG